MEESKATDDARTTVEWRRIPPRWVSEPIVKSSPYLELKLEHAGLEPSGRGDRFFPDAVPYARNGTSRIFYWRPSLAPSSDEPARWDLACASTHDLVGIGSPPATGPPLVTEGSAGTILVVDGTIAGDTTTTQVASYAPPDVSIDTVSDANVELTVDGTTHSVPAGERCRLRLAERSVEPVDADVGSTTVTPELVARFPGRRELHHPAPGATYRLFPSFGLALDDVPNPLPVPTVADELDDTALAEELSVDPAGRPYPERVLWQAFAYTAFDPHDDATPELAQLETGHIVLRKGSVRTD